MPETPVVAQSPVIFSTKGAHKMIPVTTLYFNDQGKLKADRWPGYAADAAVVDALLARLLNDGVLRKGDKPAPKPAFKATAVTGGALVQIEIEIKNVVPDNATPPNSKADFTVTETETYLALDLATLKEKVGTSASNAKSPGLVFISSAGAPVLPKAAVYALAGDPAVKDIDKNAGGGAAFSVQSRAGGADAALTTVEIKDVDTGANTFTLIATWTKTAAATAVSAMGAQFPYVITVAAPAGGFLAPVAGKISLTGGSDPIAVDAVKPSVTVPAQ